MKIIITLLGCMIALSTYGQQKKYEFLKYDKKDGLSNGIVTTIYEDELGFMWFGTYDGVNRFDGYKFEIFNINNIPQKRLSGNYIHKITGDGNGHVFITSNQGLDVFDLKTETITSYVPNDDNPKSLPSVNPQDVLLDKHGKIWVTSLGRLSLFDITKGEFEVVPLNLADLEYVTFQCIRQTSDGLIYLTTSRGSVISYDPETQSSQEYSFTNDHVKAITMILSDDGKIWIGDSILTDYIYLILLLLILSNINTLIIQMA